MAKETAEGSAGPAGRMSREALFWGLVAAGVAIDQASKLAVFAALGPAGGSPQGTAVIPGFFFLTPRLNPGMAWSLFAGLGSAQPALLALLNVAITGAVIWYRRTTRVVSGRPVFDTGLGLVLAGAIGNLIDRLHPPFRVMDFLHFRFWTWDYPVFNVADIYIVAGVAVFMYWGWRLERRPGAGAEA